MAKRKKHYRLFIETGKYTVSGAAVRLKKPTRKDARQLRSLLIAFGAGHLIEQIPSLAKRKPGRPKKRR